jgi:hypothetical protein
MHYLVIRSVFGLKIVQQTENDMYLLCHVLRKDQGKRLKKKLDTNYTNLHE